jgi:hypothetical protein
MRLWAVVKTCDVTIGIDPVGHHRGGRCKRGQRVRTTEGIKSGGYPNVMDRQWAGSVA